MEIVFFGEFHERLGDVVDESAVVISQSEKCLDVFEVGWNGPFDDSNNFGRVYLDLVFQDDVTEVDHRLFEKLTL